MAQLEQSTLSQTIIDQLTDELCDYNRGLIIELPRWMH